MNKKNSEEKVKNFRIARICDEIGAGRYPNAEKLAEKLEVSSRTILRDIEYLKHTYGAPIEYDHNKRGFYYTEPNFFVGSIILTDSEFETLRNYDHLIKN
jgi:proteasome accessory factor B